MPRMLVATIFISLILSGTAIFCILLIEDHIATQTQKTETLLSNTDQLVKDTNAELGRASEIVTNTKTTVDNLEARMASLEDRISKIEEEGVQVTDPPKNDPPVTEKPDETPINDEPDDVPVVEKTTVTVAVSQLNFRTGSGLNAASIRTLNTGEKLEFLGETVSKDGYNWIKVKDHQGKTGWVAKKFVTE